MVTHVQLRLSRSEVQNFVSLFIVALLACFLTHLNTVI